MQLFIFKTNIATKKKVASLKPLLKQNTAIVKWNVDTQDCDKVLRIEAKNTAQENELINIIQAYGYHCEPLNY